MDIPFWAFCALLVALVYVSLLYLAARMGAEGLIAYMLGVRAADTEGSRDVDPAWGQICAHSQGVRFRRISYPEDGFHIRGCVYDRFPQERKWQP